MEIIIGIAILGAALSIFIKNWKKSTAGVCNCDGCDTACPSFDDKEAGKIAFVKKR